MTQNGIIDLVINLNLNFYRDMVLEIELEKVDVDSYAAAVDDDDDVSVDYAVLHVTVHHCLLEASYSTIHSRTTTN